MSLHEDQVVVHLFSEKRESTAQYTKLDSKLVEYDVKKDEVPDIVNVLSLETYVKAEEQLTVMKSSVREFYRRQNQAIEAYKVAAKIKETGQPEVQESEGAESERWTHCMVRVSVYCNVLLFVAKVIAAAWSGSLALIASAIDSALDILSGLILFFTNKAINKHEPYKYPQGKSRLEPLGIMLFAMAMGMAGLEVIVESVQDLQSGFTGSPRDLKIDTLPITVLCVTIVLKTGLYSFCRLLACRDMASSSVETLQDDHRNDVLTNLVALAAALVASRIHYLWFFDPIGAILLSAWIVFSWYHNGKNQVAFLIGKAAPPEFISQIVYMAAHHSHEILRVDTVLAYHYGVKFMVECHIGLRMNITLKEAHDIGESLEQQIEKLDLVEKCFVHLDYEWRHKPEYQRRYKKEDRSSGDHPQEKTSFLRTIGGSIRNLARGTPPSEKPSDEKAETEASPLRREGPSEKKSANTTPVVTPEAEAPSTSDFTTPQTSPQPEPPKPDSL